MCYNNKIEDFLDRLQRAIDDAGNIMILVEDLEEAFPELKERKDENVRKAIIEFFELQDDNTTYSFVSKKKILDWLEKQGKKKPTDKIELRFKVGDWVVNKFGHVWRVDSFDEKNYQVSNQKGDNCYFKISKQDDFHLWTIEDAKDGDVLANGSNIFIFHFIIGTRVREYCHVNTNDGRFYDDMPDTGCFGLIGDIFTPATKEQRDLLFQKMKEAGYKLSEEEE